MATSGLPQSQLARLWSLLVAVVASGSKCAQALPRSLARPPAKAQVTSHAPPPKPELDPNHRTRTNRSTRPPHRSFENLLASQYLDSVQLHGSASAS
ncbi:hypothetical protein DRE_01408 [Drechslerella stenobrocha 248]|uniref:EH domain-containing protein n=1 Tax=Drechslerella stenobrocha 248 TaxID=1043628 RepID=W7HJF4_9PEZI|nr:hypothetical protein DRE_01408 [Drechslerella stenobrocha 248]